MSLDALTQAARAATPGPWRWQGGPNPGTGYVLGPGHEDFLTGPLRNANAAHIALNDPQTTLALIAVVRAAGDGLDALIWTSGSPSFAPDGEAREGWVRVAQPAIDALRAALDAAREAGVLP